MYLTGLGFGDDTSITSLPFVAAFVDHDPPAVVLVLVAGDADRRANGETEGRSTAAGV